MPEEKSSVKQSFNPEKWVRMSFLLPIDMNRKITELACAHYVSRSSIVREAIISMLGSITDDPSVPEEPQVAPASKSAHRRATVAFAPKNPRIEDSSHSAAETPEDAL